MACEGQDPDTMPGDRNDIKRVTKHYLGEFLTAIAAEHHARELERRIPGGGGGGD